MSGYANKDDALMWTRFPVNWIQIAPILGGALTTAAAFKAIVSFTKIAPQTIAVLQLDVLNDPPAPRVSNLRNSKSCR